MDLFTPRVPNARFHPNFAMALKASPEDRAVLSTWADGFVDRDGKFAIEFQTTFNSSFWELYLFACLKELAHTVDFSVEAPDFVVPGTLTAFCLEATSANNAQGAAPEWSATAESFMALEDRAPIVAEATIRLANAVDKKRIKFRDSYAALPHVAGRPFVVAVAPFEHPHFRVQNTQAMRRVLYAYDATPFEVVPGAAGAVSVTGGEFFDVPTARKANGADISLGYFRSDGMKEVSAVVFSSTATWGKVRALSNDPNPNVMFDMLRYNANGPQPIHEVLPKPRYQEPLLDGLHVFHNPFATHPLAWDTFRARGVVQETWQPEERKPYVEAAHGALIQRTVVTLMTRPLSGPSASAPSPR